MVEIPTRDRRTLYLTIISVANGCLWSLRITEGMFARERCTRHGEGTVQRLYSSVRTVDVYIVLPHGPTGCPSLRRPPDDDMILVFGDALSRARKMTLASATVSSFRGTPRRGANSPEEERSDKRLSFDPFGDNFTGVIDFEITTGGYSVPLTVLLPLGAMALFAALILLVVLFRRYPAAVMTMAAASLLAAGVYNIFLVLFQSSAAAPPYQDGYDPQKPPTYE